MQAGENVLALGNPRRQCALVIRSFQSKGRKLRAAAAPSMHVKDELVGRPWPGCPAPGWEPGCPEMSSGSLGGRGGDSNPFPCT
jgi:hypothetical protein